MVELEKHKAFVVSKEAMIFLRSLCLALFAFGLSSCGYHSQNRVNPLEKIGVRKIFVDTFNNKTYRPGLEHNFTTAMVREIRKGGAFTVVGRREDADAVLKGTLFHVDDLPSPGSVRLGDGRDSTVATSFVAAVSCLITLTDIDGRVIFSEAFSSSKGHPASLVILDNRLVDQQANATAPLINESEQRLAIRYLSEQIIFDAYQRMIEVF